MKRIGFVVLILVLAIGIVSLGETITLNFMQVLTSPQRTAWWEQVIKDFEALNPNIKINLISPPYEQADNKLTTMLMGKQPLDIIEVRDYTIKQLVDNGWLTNLTPYIATWSASKTLIPLAWQAAKTVNNTPYMIPQSFFVKALFVRTDILAKYGINPDDLKTWQDVLNACQKLYNPSKNQYGWDNRGKNSPFIFPDTLATSFVENANPDNLYILPNGQTIFTSPQYKAGWEMYIKLFKTSPQDSINWGFDSQVNSFVSGVTPILMQDPDTVGLLNTMLDKDQYTVVPLPVGPTGKAYPNYGFNGLGIVSYSQHKEAAWKFIAYVSSPEVNAWFNKNYGPLPISSVTYENDPYFSTGVYSAWAYMMKHPEKYIFSNYPFNSSKWPGWPSIQQADMQSLLLGNISLDAVLAKWNNYWSSK
ncbi:ABC transporter substrate-binding protein [Athalassotoga saccharophila]|uniref:ABC transporter substrate-binding protein n=1 Tax=Athalassotoga saccharophila TaxID=1441386 RepID=UPI0013799803|nr:sugar ABC transporter substrate-binding protein [Athalassotoga saccharophila]BBJ28440.1 ABC transporter, substrate-binding protein [Athalassotoga saccharophila]